MSPHPVDFTLWVDVTMLLGLRGAPSGIPRTLSQILHHWLGDDRLPIRLCRFDNLLRRYVVVSTRSFLARPICGSSTRRYRPLRRKGPRFWIPGDVRQAGSHLAGLGLCLGKLVGKIAARLFDLARWSLSKCLPASGVPPFAPGDVLLLAGAGWAENAASDVLEPMRQRLGLRVVHLIYDVTPVRMPHLCPPRYAEVFARWLPGALTASDLVLTISEYSRQDLRSYAREHGLPCPPVEPIRLGDEPGADLTQTRPAELPDWLTGPFALCVSALTPHKNQHLVVNVWRRLLERHGAALPPLLLVGTAGWKSDVLLEEIRRDPRLERHVIHLSHVDDQQLRWLYGQCLFTLYPSHYEGWGLPVAESLVHGKYCICSSSTSLPEVGGNLVDHHDPLDALGCERLVERALYEPGWLSRREERVRHEFRHTSWRECAKQTLAIVKEVFRSNPAQAA